MQDLLEGSGTSVHKDRGDVGGGIGWLGFNCHGGQLACGDLREGQRTKRGVRYANVSQTGKSDYQCF